MAQSALFSLDEPKPLSTVGKICWAVGVVAYGVVSAYVFTRRAEVLEPVLWVPVAHALVLAAVCAFTAVLILGQATTSGRRGYLWLGGTYLYVAGVLLTFPLFFPGALRSDTPLVGGPQSAVSLFYFWHLGFLFGVIVSIWVLWDDQRRHRRPGLRSGAWPTVAVVAVLVVTTLLLVAQGSALLPPLLDENGAITPLGIALDRVMLALSMVAVLLSAYTVRGGAQIQRWLLALSLLLLGEGIVNLASTGRWTFGWYFDRLFGMVALTALFLALLWIIANVGRDTNRMAVSDPLTGSESRASFTKAMDRELAAATEEGRNLALLWIDLDGFKSVNDQLGHAIGDAVLRETVQRIQGQVRVNDHVGRLGGDEFGVLLCDRVEDSRIGAVADRILASLREPISIDNSTTLLTGSIGIATSPSDAVGPEDLLLRADLAMYSAKNAGGDRFQRFSKNLGAAALGKAQLRHNLAQALRNSEFDLDFQPIIIPATGEVAGYEALVCWQQPHERTPAREFIEFAEQSGQILQIGRQVIDLLERDAAGLLDRLGEGGFVTFNLSVKELADPIAMQRLLGGALSGLASQLIVEVTESLELQTLTEAELNLERLRRAGYRLALDDFGAGFSNFSRLEQLHPYLLKVDRSLVVRAGSNIEGGVAFLTAAVSVAESLQCQVVAEGVETAAEDEIVRLLNIDYAQGFRYGRPRPVAAMRGETRPRLGPQRSDSPYQESE